MSPHSMAMQGLELHELWSYCAPLTAASSVFHAPSLQLLGLGSRSFMVIQFMQLGLGAKCSSDPRQAEFRKAKDQ